MNCPKCQSSYTDLMGSYLFCLSCKWNGIPKDEEVTSVFNYVPVLEENDEVVSEILYTEPTPEILLNELEEFNEAVIFSISNSHPEKDLLIKWNDSDEIYLAPNSFFTINPEIESDIMTHNIRSHNINETNINCKIVFLIP